MAQFPQEQAEDGSFQRQEDAFRAWVSNAADAVHPLARNRYHLYVSLACPWAHRTLIVRRLLGLEDVIGITIADPVRDDRGWAFREGPGHTADQANGFRFLAEAYEKSNPHFEGRVTVPVLWDNERQVIVNNSEDDICRMLAEVFQPYHRHVVDLFPRHLAQKQEELSQHIYETVNNGVYEAGFASHQEVYDQAFARLFRSLDDLDEKLSSQRYLLDERPVETDWRLFCTLIRFDAVYHGHFKCNLRQIRAYPHLNRYLRDLYQQPGIAETVNFDHIKRHYYMTHDDINPTRIVPLGPDLGWLNEPVE